MDDIYIYIYERRLFAYPHRKSHQISSAGDLTSHIFHIPMDDPPRILAGGHFGYWTHQSNGSQNPLTQ